MKLKNKKTGKIKNVNHAHILVHFNDGETMCVKSLKDLTEEWEDYEEPKRGWFINSIGNVYDDYCLDEDMQESQRSIGNYFETEEEAEKAVEKLKAWKRLKDAGFNFHFWIYDYRQADNEVECGLSIGASYDQRSKIDVHDINLLFGGEDVDY